MYRQEHVPLSNASTDVDLDSTPGTGIGVSVKLIPKTGSSSVDPARRGLCADYLSKRSDKRVVNLRSVSAARRLASTPGKPMANRISNMTNTAEPESKMRLA